MDEILTENFDISKRNAKRNFIICFITILILLSLATIFIILYAFEKNKKDEKENDNDNDNDTPKKDFLSLWEDNRDSKNSLINFIKNITNKDSQNFVPIEDRIAVFDFDGTLFQETDPIYLDHQLFIYRVLNDSDYKEKASPEERDFAIELKELADKGKAPSLNLEFAKLNAQIYKNMGIEELYEYTKKFLELPANGYNNMKKGDAFYKPMLEVVDYLKQNDFIVYVVTGTDTFTARVIIDGHINIPKSQVIGSEANIVANNQFDTDGLNYIYSKNDSLEFKGELVAKNLNMNKVYYIIKTIGKIPLISFGNSGSDSSMAEFALQNPKGIAFMVLCDDLVRERGNKDKAESFRKSCEENNWIPISMRDDWKTIYGDNVTRKNN